LFCSCSSRSCAASNAGDGSAEVYRSVTTRPHSRYLRSQRIITRTHDPLTDQEAVCILLLRYTPHKGYGDIASPSPQKGLHAKGANNTRSSARYATSLIN
jgi:hypothetical protein